MEKILIMLPYIILGILMLLCHFISWLNETKDKKTAEKFEIFSDVFGFAMVLFCIFLIAFLVVVKFIYAPIDVPCNCGCNCC